jgi:hypothetical protein
MIYADVFDTMDEAIAFQRQTLLNIIAKAEVVRSSDLNWETDFDTKKQRFKVYIRTFLFG